MTSKELQAEIGELAERALAEYPTAAGLLFAVGAHLAMNNEQELKEMLHRARPGMLRGVRDIDRLKNRGEM